MPAARLLRARLVAAALAGAAASGAFAAGEPHPAEWIDFAQSKRKFDRLLADPDYDLIERAANELGYSRARFPTGEYHFEALYLSMVGMIQLTGVQGARIAKEWTAAKGAYGYAQLAQALVYYGRAWTVRTNQAAHTVSPEAWELFYSNLEQANSTLDSASARLKQSGPWHALKLSVAFHHPRYKSERLRLLQTASSAWPDYLAVYTIPMEIVHPKRGGSFELMEGVARFALSSTQGSHGAAIYALVYERAFRTDRDYSIASAMADWATLKQGFRDLESRRPLPPLLWRNFANLACHMRDKVEARRLYAIYDRLRDDTMAEDSDPCRQFAMS
jgi:hypothetical protein